MHFKFAGLSVWMFALALVACHEVDAPASPNEHTSWQQDRLERLTAPQSWTALIGLHWLADSIQTMGTTEESEIRVNTDGYPFIGTWTVSEAQILFEPAPQIDVQLNGNTFSGGAVNIQEDVLSTGTLIWMLIQRDTLIGIRIWDTLSTARSSLHEIPAFAYDPDWRIEASVSASEGDITLDNVLGMSISYPIEGVLTFEVDGVPVVLYAIPGGPEQLFVIFEDMTTGSDTYSGGRYLYCSLPDASGTTMLDFNKAINPPCVFTEFATCLLPPKQNFIPVRVEAGERVPDGH